MIDETPELTMAQTHSFARMDEMEATPDVFSKNKGSLMGDLLGSARDDGKDGDIEDEHKMLILSGHKLFSDLERSVGRRSDKKLYGLENILYQHGSGAKETRRATDGNHQLNKAQRGLVVHSNNCISLKNNSHFAGQSSFYTEANKRNSNEGIARLPGSLVMNQNQIKVSKSQARVQQSSIHNKNHIRRTLWPLKDIPPPQADFRNLFSDYSENHESSSLQPQILDFGKSNFSLTKSTHDQFSAEQYKPNFSSSSKDENQKIGSGSSFYKKMGLVDIKEEEEEEEEDLFQDNSETQIKDTTNPKSEVLANPKNKNQMTRHHHFTNLTVNNRPDLFTKNNNTTANNQNNIKSTKHYKRLTSKLGKKTQLTSNNLNKNYQPHKNHSQDSVLDQCQQFFETSLKKIKDSAAENPSIYQSENQSVADLILETKINLERSIENHSRTSHTDQRIANFLMSGEKPKREKAIKSGDKRRSSARDLLRQAEISRSANKRKKSQSHSELFGIISGIEKSKLSNPKNSRNGLNKDLKGKEPQGSNQGQSNKEYLPSSSNLLNENQPQASKRNSMDHQISYQVSLHGSHSKPSLLREGAKQSKNWDQSPIFGISNPNTTKNSHPRLKLDEAVRLMQESTLRRNQASFMDWNLSSQPNIRTPLSNLDEPEAKQGVHALKSHIEFDLRPEIPSSKHHSKPDKKIPNYSNQSKSKIAKKSIFNKAAAEKKLNPNQENLANFDRRISFSNPQHFQVNPQFKSESQPQPRQENSLFAKRRNKRNQLKDINIFSEQTSLFPQSKNKSADIKNLNPQASLIQSQGIPKKDQPNPLNISFAQASPISPDKSSKVHQTEIIRTDIKMKNVNGKFILTNPTQPTKKNLFKNKNETLTSHKPKNSFDQSQKVYKQLPAQNPNNYNIKKRILSPAKIKTTKKTNPQNLASMLIRNLHVDHSNKISKNNRPATPQNKPNQPPLKLEVPISQALPAHLHTTPTPHVHSIQKPRHTQSTKIEEFATPEPHRLSGSSLFQKTQEQSQMGFKRSRKLKAPIRKFETPEMKLQALGKRTSSFAKRMSTPDENEKKIVQRSKRVSRPVFQEASF